MDAELLSEQVNTLNTAIVRLDGRIDSHEEVLTECRTLLAQVSERLNSSLTMDQVTAHLAELEAQRALAAEERMQAEAAAMEAMAEAAEAQAELAEAELAMEAAPEEAEAPEVEVIEVEEAPEPEPTIPSRQGGDFEEMTRGR
jgi:chromosome segregation ATPase